MPKAPPMDRSDSLIRDDETLESLFGGRLKILQKKKGYRYTIDSVLLAHFVEPKKGERILELGAGSGVISLLLAFRNPGVRVTGLELQADLADMAGRSISTNCLVGRVNIIQGDVRNIAEFLESRSKDVVVFNPPYRKMGSGKLN